MKQVAKAIQNVKIDHFGQYLVIGKNETFELYDNKLIQFRGNLVDISNMMYAFEVTEEEGEPTPFTAVFGKDFFVTNDLDEVSWFPKGTKVATTRTVIVMNKVILDISRITGVLSVEGGAVSDDGLQLADINRGSAKLNLNVRPTEHVGEDVDYYMTLDSYEGVGVHFNNEHIWVNSNNFLLGTRPYANESIPIAISKPEGGDINVTIEVKQGEEVLNTYSGTYSITACDTAVITVNAENCDVIPDKIVTCEAGKARFKVVANKGFTLEKAVINQGGVETEEQLNNVTEWDKILEGIQVDTIVTVIATASTMRTVTVTADNCTVEPQSPIQTYDGETVEVMITPNEGYDLKSVTVDSVAEEGVQPTGHTVNIAAVSKDIEIVATAAIKTFQIIGTLQNATSEPALPATVNYGATQAVVITPAAGYNLTGVTVDGEPEASVEPTGHTVNFTDVKENHTIEITTAIKTYQITGDLTNITTAPELPQTVNHGDDLEIVATPTTNYEITTYKLDNEDQDIDNPESLTISLSDIQAAHTIELGATIKKYQVTGSGSNCSFSPTLPKSVDHGGNLSITITPTAGYKLTEVKLDNAAESLDSEDGHVINLTNVTVAHAITVTTAKKSYQITGSGDNVTFDPTLPQTVEHGTAFEVEVTPATGYDLTGVTVDTVPEASVEPTGHTVNIASVTKATAIAATTAIKTFQITGSGENIAFEPTLPASVNYNSNQDVTITANEGYKLTSVKVNEVDEDLDGEDSHVVHLTSVTEAKAIVVVAEAKTFQVTGSGSNYTASPTLPQSVNYGSSLDITITPAEGYKLTGISVNETPEVLDGESSHVVHLTNVVEAKTIAVTTEAITYQITGSGATFNPELPLTVNQGADQTITITPVETQLLATIKVNNADQAINDPSSHQLELTDIQETKNIVVTCGIPANISLSAEGDFTTNPEMPLVAAVGAHIVITITPTAGNQITSVSIDDEPMEQINPVQTIVDLNPVAADTTITVTTGPTA